MLPLQRRSNPLEVGQLVIHADIVDTGCDGKIVGATTAGGAGLIPLALIEAAITINELSDESPEVSPCAVINGESAVSADGRPSSVQALRNWVSARLWI